MIDRTAWRKACAAGRLVRAMAQRRWKPASGGSIGYIGALSDGNLGDLACLAAATRILQPARLIVVNSEWDERRLRMLGHPLSRFADAVVLGGGTLLNYHRVPLAKELLAQGLRLFTLGTGVGPCGFPESDAVALDEWQRLWKSLSNFAVRGPDSEERLRRLGATNVKVVGDLALALAADRASLPANRKRIALCVAMPEQPRYGEGLFRGFFALERALTRLISLGYEFVPLFIESKDVETYQLLQGRVPRLPVNGPFEPSVTKLMENLALCSAVVTVRLHGAVLATCLGVPSVALSYGPKCAEFQRSIGRSEFCQELEILDEQWVVEKVQAAASTSDAERENLAATAREFRSRLEMEADMVRADLRAHSSNPRRFAAAEAAMRPMEP